MAINLEISYDTWDLDPEFGRAPHLFDGTVVGSTNHGYWVVHLDRALDFGGKAVRYVALTPRYVDQAIISLEGAFPYTSSTIFLTEEQAKNHILDQATIESLPGLRGVVRLR